MTDITIIRTIVIVCVAGAFGLCWALTPLSGIVARKIGAIDIPKDDRRMHDKPVPRFGGLAIFLSVSVLVLAIKFIFFPFSFLSRLYDEPVDLIMTIFIGGVLIFVVGTIDDIKPLSAMVKLLGQCACACVTFALGIRIEIISLLGMSFAQDSMGGVILSLVVTVVWIVAIINMINLIDGMDGLAAGVVGIAALAIAYSGYIHGQYTVTLLMCAVAGASFGFLPVNFYSAKMIMGDSGAMFLGYMLASVSVIGPTKGATLVASFVPILVLGVPIFDTVFAILRRRLRGEPIFKPDKGHLHHQLYSLGMGQRRTVLMIYGVCSVMGVAAIIFSRRLYIESAFLFIVALLFIFTLVWGWNKSKKKKS